MTQPKDEPELEYESPEILEFGNVEELTFGPSQNSTPDHTQIQYDDGGKPC